MAAFEEAEQAARALLPALPHAGMMAGYDLCAQGITTKPVGDEVTAIERFATVISSLRAPGGGRRLDDLLGELGIL